MDIATAGTKARAVRTAVHSAIVGKDDVLDRIIVGLVADGHLLIEGSGRR